MGREPQQSRGLGGINPSITPPRCFIAVTVDVAVVASAERHGELVTDFAAECAALCEAEMVGIAGLPAADQARLLRDVTEVVAIADAPRLREGKRGLVDGLALPASAPLRLAFSVAYRSLASGSSVFRMTPDASRR